MANGTGKSIAKGLGQGAAAFGVGAVISSVSKVLIATFRSQPPTPITLGNWNFFVNWIGDPINATSLVAGVLLSAVPQKPGSNGRAAARLAGAAILGIQGYNFAPSIVDPPNPMVTAQYANWNPYYAPAITFPRGVPGPSQNYAVKDVFVQAPRAANLF